MPYDEEGKFLYPLPAAKKGTPRRRKDNATGPSSTIPLIKPEVITAPAPVPEEVPVTIPVNIPQPLTAIGDMPRPVFPCTERELAELWNAQGWPDGVILKTTKGLPVRVVYRGRWSGGYGPDFKGAILEIGGELKKGDVELHLSGVDWNLHGHGKNNQYDNVVLHVALEQNQPVINSQGQAVEAIALLELFQGGIRELQFAIEKAQQSGTRLGSLSESEGPCCEQVAARHPDLHEVLSRIDDLGRKRFEEKAARFEAALAVSEDLAQPFWEGLLEALGYSQNKAPFLKLARLLPWNAIARLQNEEKGSREEKVISVTACLLGAAGLLTEQRRERNKLLLANSEGDILDPEDWAAAEYVDELERRWHWLEKYLKTSSSGAEPFRRMQEQDWNFARLRPVNHPARRMAGLARWLVKSASTEPEELPVLLQEKITAAKPAEEILALFMVETGQPEDYWTNRYDLSMAKLPGIETGKTPPALVGQDRAAEIAVNVVLPYMLAHAGFTGNREVADKTLSAYRAFPRPGSNELVENVARQVFGYWLDSPEKLPPEFQAKGRKSPLNLLLGGALRQQGLIQLHRQYCTAQDWVACPLS